jgi:fibro-slime domain-containing protein
MRSLMLVLLVACGAHHGGDGTDSNGGGNGDGGDGDGNGSSVDALPCGTLLANFRDFQSSHPDFEKTIADDRNLVKVDLGVDGKPQYAPAGATATVSGQTSFDQWYRDTAGVNIHIDQLLPLTEAPPGTFTFDNQAFFPLDGMGFPETFFGHNFHFTTELHGSFVYRGGELFSFTGDDDVFVFVNKKLALDLGGVHGAETASIDFDARAASLGLSIGGTYELAVFHAERHTTESHFRMSTTIDCFIVE